MKICLVSLVHEERIRHSGTLTELRAGGTNAKDDIRHEYCNSSFLF